MLKARNMCHESRLEYYRNVRAYFILNIFNSQGVRARDPWAVMYGYVCRGDVAPVEVHR